LVAHVVELQLGAGRHDRDVARIEVGGLAVDLETQPAGEHVHDLLVADPVGHAGRAGRDLAAPGADLLGPGTGVGVRDEPHAVDLVGDGLVVVDERHGAS